MLRIAICDDDPHMLSSLAALCKKILPEAEVTEYKSGVELLSGNGGFEIILMDVRMPVMNGYEATREIRRLAREDARQIPIVAMTADAFSSDIKMALNAGMNEHLSKPVSIERLQEVLGQWL